MSTVRTSSSRRNRAFTLVEMLAILAVIGMVMGLTLPYLNRARHKARRAACLMNLRQIYCGYVAYAADHEGQLPPKYEIKKTTLSASDAAEGRVLNTIERGIQTELAPYVRSPTVFRCPADTGDARNSTPLWKRRGESYEVKGVLAKEWGTAKAYFATRGSDLVVSDPFKPWEAAEKLTVMEKIAKGEHGPKDWHHGYCNIILPSGRAVSVRTKEEEKAEQNKE